MFFNKTHKLQSQYSDTDCSKLKMVDTRVHFNKKWCLLIFVHNIVTAIEKIDRLTLDELLSNDCRCKQFRRGHRLEKILWCKNSWLIWGSKQRPLGWESMTLIVYTRATYIQWALTISFILNRLNFWIARNWKHSQQIAGK